MDFWMIAVLLGVAGVGFLIGRVRLGKDDLSTSSDSNATSAGMAVATRGTDGSGSATSLRLNRRQILATGAIAAGAGLVPLPVSAWTFRGTQIVVNPSGGNDLAALDEALAASALTGAEVFLGDGRFFISDTLIIPPGAHLRGQRQTTPLHYLGNQSEPLLLVQEPALADPVVDLFVVERRQPAPYRGFVGPFGAS